MWVDENRLQKESGIMSEKKENKTLKEDEDESKPHKELSKASSIELAGCRTFHITDSIHISAKEI